MKKSKQSNNKTNQYITEEMKYISSLINQDKFQEALERIKSYEMQNPNDKTLQFNKLGFLVDIGFGLNDQNIIRQGLGIGEQNLKNQKDTKYSSNIHYNLANGYLSLYGLAERKTGIETIPQSENLQKAKLHFRESLKLCEEFNCDFKKQVFVNYGNCLEALGRGVEGLNAYDNAIKIDKKFSMAIGNRAEALRFFADISGQYRGAIYLEAYQAIKSIIDNQDLIAIGGLDAKKSFENELQKIESLFKDKKDLTKKLEHSKYSTIKLSEF
jgi:tetratricopeptide (TPR) repeat protein